MILNGKFPPYDEIFKHLVKVVSSETFLKKQGLGKEVPFFIFPFSPADALRIEDDVIDVIKKLSGSYYNGPGWKHNICKNASRFPGRNRKSFCNTGDVWCCWRRSDR